MPDNDFWGECYDPGMGLGTKEFENTFCRVCRNQDCVRSAASGLQWVHRMATQEERLLINPTFADVHDPRFEPIRTMPFQGIRPALVVPGRPTDWQDTRKLPAPPPNVEPPPQAKPNPAVPAPPPEQAKPNTVAPKPPVQEGPPPKVLREAQMRGSGNEVYRVALEQVGDAEPSWSCTCRAFMFGTSRPCKHVLFVSSQPEAEPPAPAPTPPPAAPQPSGPPPTRFTGQPPVMPRLANIPVPSEGVMVDGSKPPPQVRPEPAKAKDPWAAPPKKPANVIPVGGKVVLGKKEK